MNFNDVYIVQTPILNSRCYQYAEKVSAGIISASKKNVKASNRFIKDLESQGKRGYVWKFDLERATRPVNFIEKFMKPTKGNYHHMQLMDWQCFVNGNVYGWVHSKTGYRRFKEALVVVARGNGKTTLIAGNSAYAASKDKENGADVYVLANSKEQASILFEDVKANINHSALLSKHFRTTNHAIYFDRTNSKIQHRASDSRRLDGLNAHMATFDEIHEFASFKLINVIKRSTNKRTQPLIWYITTLGNKLDGPLMSLYQLADNILNESEAVSKRVADRFFCYIAEIDEEDDVEDSECWIKANPSLGTLLDLETLKDDWNRAKLIPEERSDFINKQLNVFTAIDEMSLFDVETIRKNNKELNCDLLNGKLCYGGFDLSSSEDYTSACLEFPLDNGEFYVLSHTWTTSKKVKLDNEHLDYKYLEQEGHMTIIQGDYIQYEHVYNWFVKMSERYNIDCIGYDPANAPFLVQKLLNHGLALSVVRQGAITLNAPLKDLKEKFLSCGIIHNNNPMLNWYFSNVKLRQDRNGNWLPTKQNRYRKIDGFAALLDAHCVYMENNPFQKDITANPVTVIKI